MAEKMTKEEWYNQLFLGLGRSKFRSSFHLKQKDIYYINEKGEKWYIRGQSISYEPYEFKFLDIIKYLKVLEEI